MIFNSYPPPVRFAQAMASPTITTVSQAAAFEEIAMYRTAGVTLGGQAIAAERVPSMPVTPSPFRLLRVEPLRGRIFTEQEAEVGQNRKVILSYGLWQRLFGGRDEAVGKELRINGNQFTIVGVMPREFRFIDPEVTVDRGRVHGAGTVGR